MTKPRLDQGADYERGFVDGMQHQMQSNVDKAVNRMAQRKPLTDEDVERIVREARVGEHGIGYTIARAIEAAHDIKE